MSDPQPPTVDFAKRVQHFDVVESDKSDDDDDVPRGAKVKTTDDIEKEYLMGGRTSFGDDDDGGDVQAVDGGCCPQSCGGNDKAARVEGRGVLIGATVVSMALGGLLLYSCWHEWRAANRFYVVACGFALGVFAELCAALGLIGLCRFTDTSKFVFQLAFWVNLVQYWAYAVYFVFLLFAWDGDFRHGTAPLRAPAPAAPATGGVTGAATTPALLELAVELNAESAAEAMAAAAAGALAPAKSASSSPAEQWNALLGTQIWFLGLALGQLLCSVLYVYGSLRLRCKKMGKAATGVTGFLVICAALATLALAAFTIRFNTQLLTPVGLSPIVAQMAVAVLICATVIYEWVVSTRVAKLKLAVKPSFVTLQIMSWVAFGAVSVCHYTYYQSLHHTPRIDLLHLTALAGTLSQALLLVFAVQLVAWQYALSDEYPALPTVEKFGPAFADESDPFVPPPREPLEI